MRRAHLCLAAVLVLGFGYTARSNYVWWHEFPDGDIGSLPGPGFFWVPMAILLFMWCGLDARHRHVKMPPGAPFLVGLVWPLGVPYYFFQTYERRQALVHVGLAVLFAASCLTALWLGHSVVEYYYAVWTNN